MFWIVLNLKYISLGGDYPKSVLRLVKFWLYLPSPDSFICSGICWKNKQNTEHSYGEAWSKALGYIYSAAEF